MSKFSNLKLRYKIGAGVATGAVVLAGAGAAFATWSSTGGGTGGALTGSTGTQDIAITDDSGSNLSALGPGVADQTVTVTFKNNGNYTENVASATVTLSVKPLANKTCAATNYDINGTQYSGPVSLTAPGEIAASKTATETYKIGFYDETTDQSDCEGATVTMTYASA